MDFSRRKKTKVVATLSDARCTEAMVSRLYDAGMDVVRINSAHATEQSAKQIVDIVHRVNPSIPIMLDTKGPEIRITAIDESYGGVMTFHAGEHIEVRGTLNDEPCRRDCLYMNVPNIVRDVPVGAHMLISDGQVEIRVIERNDSRLLCEFVRDGVLHSRKSVNVPGVEIELQSVTERDRAFIRWAAENNIDFIAHSFVRSSRDVRAVQQILDECHSPIKIISKIENQQGIDNIDEIIESSYGIMVARGDLGVELPAERIPSTQRMIVERAIAAKRPVIIATQMLYSMVHSPRPTRAEVNDVASAIYERVDAVMLSDETASGDYPVESVETMSRIARAIEQDENHFAPIIDIKMVSVDHEITAQIARSAVRACTTLPIRFIITDTLSGRTGRYLAAFRGNRTVLAVCYTLHAQRILALSYGVVPILRTHDESNKYHYLLDAVDFIDQYTHLDDGDLLVSVGGSFGAKRGASYVEIATLAEIRNRTRELSAVGEDNNIKA